jgi:cell wall-associated NlpC family hydrolase
MSLNRRLNAFRPDLADSRLKGQVEAARFVDGMPRRVAAGAAPLRLEPRADASMETEVLRGEAFTVFEESPEGWSWGQLATDGYVGYVPTGTLGDPAPEPTDRIVVLRSFVYPGPDMKLPAVDWLSLGTKVATVGEAETRGTRFQVLAGGEGAIVAAHVAPVAAPPEVDFVAVAERFLNVPYLWGGRTSLGLDCSALVQLALQAAGRQAPRDTSIQQHALGQPVDGGVDAALLRGDLVFWTGHVGIMVDGEHMLHASGHHMTVVIEPLAEAAARIARAGVSLTSVRRL